MTQALSVKTGLTLNFSFYGLKYRQKNQWGELIKNHRGKIESLCKTIKESRSICVFTGAGISVPSGIPDFRSATGLYATEYGGFRPKEIISRSFFDKRPEVFYRFYEEKIIFRDAKPNDAHQLFAALEKAGKQVSVVTQNIDGLHEAAGNKNIVELHGSVHRNYCMECNTFYSLDELLKPGDLPRCPKDGALIKPDVVLYEESLDNEIINEALKALASAQLLFVVGTSLTVYPAASFVEYFRGKHRVLMNKSSTHFDGSADYVFNDDAAKVARELGQLLNLF